jgi:uncharacterized protein YndB with AHSA1/START domain
MEGDVVTSFRESVKFPPPQVVWDLITDIRRHAEFGGPKRITKVIDFDGEVAVGGGRWVSHEKFGPQKFDAPSEITEVDPGRRLEWVSYPPMKDDNRGQGGRVIWGYELSSTEDGTKLEHYMRVLEPRRGAATLKTMYKVFGLPAKQVAGGRTTLQHPQGRRAGILNGGHRARQRRRIQACSGKPPSSRPVAAAPTMDVLGRPCVLVTKPRHFTAFRFGK